MRLTWTPPAAPDAGRATEHRYDLDGDVAAIDRPDGSTIDIDRVATRRAA